MLFQTVEFLILMLAVMLGISLIKKAQGQHVLLVVASYVFYAWLDVRFLILLLLSTCIDYAGALGISGIKLTWRERFRLSLFLIVSAAFCLGLNWPLLQRTAEQWKVLGVDTSPVFTWNEFLEPGVEQFPLAFGICVAFAIIWPIVYEWFFRFSEQKRRHAFLILSMTANLGMLAIFKYGNFFLDNWVELGRHFGYEWSRMQLDVALPPGISFYTFVTMSYGIDVYRKHCPAERSFLRMALFVSYFPHLVAGPVIRPEQLLPSLKSPWVLRSERIVSGFHLCLVGLFKKVIIADWINKMVAVILNDPATVGSQTSLMLWIGSLLFAVCIYCDFSGYTDMARGVSRMLGVELPLNFDFPYFSTNIAEFWRRWHISLSTWLRDYLYISLGGSRCSPPRVYFNLMTTMVLGGMWHGASWNFVIWGTYQGLLLSIHRMWSEWKKSRPAIQNIMNTTIAKIICWAVTMYFILLGWLIFYLQKLPLISSSENGSTASLFSVVKRFVVPDGQWTITSSGLGRVSPFIALTMLILFVVLHSISFFYGRWAETFDRLPRWALVLIYAILGFLFFFCWPNEESAFIYFQF